MFLKLNTLHCAVPAAMLGWGWRLAWARGQRGALLVLQALAALLLHWCPQPGAGEPWECCSGAHCSRSATRDDPACGRLSWGWRTLHEEMAHHGWMGPSVQVDQGGLARAAWKGPGAYLTCSYQVILLFAPLIQKVLPQLLPESGTSSCTVPDTSPVHEGLQDCRSISSGTEIPAHQPAGGLVHFTSPHHPSLLVAAGFYFGIKTYF